MALKTLNDLFLHTLKDIYYAERQILRALPKMAKQAGSPELKQAIEKHRAETEGQVERLQRVFEMCNTAARGVRCDAIEGILSEANEVMEEIDDPQVKDAGMIASAQAVEHYEITRYGTLIAWAQQLGMQDAAKLLGETLQEEKNTDQALTQLAESNVNKEAAA
jgi:ferritin-like metal-binding protein YciE